MLIFGHCGQKQQCAGAKCKNVEFTVFSIPNLMVDILSKNVEFTVFSIPNLMVDIVSKNVEFTVFHIPNLMAEILKL
jgi:hypothetical protein